MKKLLSAFVILAAASLFAIPAFAATLQPPINSTINQGTVACELISGSANNPLGTFFEIYTPGNGNTGLSSGTLMTLTLSTTSGGGQPVWAAGTGITLCDGTNNPVIPAGQPAVGRPP